MSFYRHSKKKLPPHPQQILFLVLKLKVKGQVMLFFEGVGGGGGLAESFALKISLEYIAFVCLTPPSGAPSSQNSCADPCLTGSRYTIWLCMINSLW